MSLSNGNKLKAVRASYDLTDDPVPIEWCSPDGDKVYARLRRANFKDDNGKQPYVRFESEFFRSFANSGKRRREPNDREREEMQREGILKFLFADPVNPEIEMTREEFKEMLYDKNYPEFLSDVLLAVNAERPYRVERQPGPSATAENLGN